MAFPLCPSSLLFRVAFPLRPFVPSPLCPFAPSFFVPSSLCPDPCAPSSSPEGRRAYRPIHGLPTHIEDRARRRRSQDNIHKLRTYLRSLGCPGQASTWTQVRHEGDGVHRGLSGWVACLRAIIENGRRLLVAVDVWVCWLAAACQRRGALESWVVGWMAGCCLPTMGCLQVNTMYNHSMELESKVDKQGRQLDKLT